MTAKETITEISTRKTTTRTTPKDIKETMTRAATTTPKDIKETIILLFRSDLLTVQKSGHEF